MIAGRVFALLSTVKTLLVGSSSVKMRVGPAVTACGPLIEPTSPTPYDAEDTGPNRVIPTEGHLPNMDIRAVTEQDAPELRDYAAALFRENLPGIFKRPEPTLDQELSYIRSHLDQPNSTLLVAVDGGAIVGLAGLEGGMLDEERHAATLAISVAKSHRGRGIGTALVEALIAWAPGAGITRIQLWAWENNPGAIAMYERIGFVREGIARQAVVTKHQPVDVILMARLLQG